MNHAEFQTKYLSPIKKVRAALTGKSFGYYQGKQIQAELEQLIRDVAMQTYPHPGENFLEHGG